MSMNNENYKAMEHDMSDASNLSVKELGEGAVEVGKTIEEGVVGTYKKIEDGVVNAYKKVEEGAVGAYKAVEDFCVDKLFKKDGETLEEAKERLQGKK